MDSKDTKGTKDKRAVVFIDGNNFYHGMRQIPSNAVTQALVILER